MRSCRCCGLRVHRVVQRLLLEFVARRRSQLRQRRIAAALPVQAKRVAKRGDAGIGLAVVRQVRLQRLRVVGGQCLAGLTIVSGQRRIAAPIVRRQRIGAGAEVRAERRDRRAEVRVQRVGAGVDVAGRLALRGVQTANLVSSGLFLIAGSENIKICPWGWSSRSLEASEFAM
jgi:hypothetical protein